MEKNIWKITLIVIALIFLIQIPIVLALDFDNIKSVKEKIGKAGYPDLEIKNAFGLGKTLWSGSLETNTEVCGINCEATQTITLYEEGSLVDDIIFKTLQEDGSWIEQGIRSYDVLIKTGSQPYEVDDYKWTCTPTGKININGTAEQTCENKLIGTHTEYTNEWQSYSLGTKKDAGTYEVKLIGEKKSTRTVDWVYRTQGVQLSDWAVWGSSNLEGGLQSYYDFEDNADKVAGVRNLTVRDGQILFSPGLIGNAGSFNAARSMNISYTDTDPQWNFTANTTMNVWLYKTSDALSSTFYTKGSTQYAYMVVGSSNLGFLSIVPVTGNGGVPLNNWQMLTLVINDTNGTLYIDGIYNQTKSKIITEGSGNVSLGDGTDIAEGNFVGLMDELGTWSRALSASEVSDLYNGGSGRAFSDFGNAVVTLNSPIDYYNTTITNNIFNASAEITSGATIVNMSLWTNATGTWGPVNTTLLTGTSNSSELSYNFTSNGNFLWNFQACDSDGDCGFSGSNRTIGIRDIIVNSEIYNYTIYETASETYIINVTARHPEYLTSANLIWNGTAYVGIKYLDTWIRTFDIPTGGGINKSFYWNFTYAGVVTSSDSHEITINSTNLSICGGSGGTTVFLNFSFIDETAGTAMNASNDLADFDYWLGDGTVTKNYIFTNTTANPQYSFCVIPNRTTTIDLSYKFSNTGYPQRTFAYDNQALTNVTTQKTLYLLPSADGIYTSIQLAETSGGIIAGVLVQIEREIGGVWTLISQGLTGADGLVTFWVNPNYEHRITASKATYITSQVIITPTQTLYTFVLTKTTGGGASYNLSISGLQWEIYPGLGPTNPGTYNFNTTIYSTEENLENCKIEILDENYTVLTSDTSTLVNTTYCFADVIYTLSEGERIYGRILADTTETTGYVILTGDILWLGLAAGDTPWRNLKGFFTDLKDLQEFGEGNEATFSRLIFFFLILTILLGVFIYFSGIEMSNPGFVLILFWFIILVASYGGFLTISIGDGEATAWIKQYIVCLITFFWIAGHTINLLRREQK